MVFGGKKKQKEEMQSIAIDSGAPVEEPFLADNPIFSQPRQEPQFPEPQFQQQTPVPVQQQQQPAQQPMQQPAQQTVQPQQTPNYQARILRGELQEGGTYVYVVETNYPLQIGDCKIVNI